MNVRIPPTPAAAALALTLAVPLMTACDAASTPLIAADADAGTTAAPDAAAHDATSPDTRAPAPASRLTVIDTMGFATPEAGVDGTPGFDLDGVISDGRERESCGHADATAPDGTPGVDNQLASLVPLFTLAGLGAAEDLIQDAVTNGGLLLLFQLDGVDSWRDDPEVTLTLRAGAGVPLLGTDGLLLAGQTFGLHPESPETVAGAAAIRDGVLEAGPFDLQIPVEVFGLSYKLLLSESRVRARLTEDGGLADGLLGGAVAYEDLLEVGRLAARDDGSVLPAIEAVFGQALDLRPDADGRCSHVSGAFRFSAVSAFLF
jgi:hypothetical protein